MKNEEEDDELDMTEEQLQSWVQAEVNKDEKLVQRRAQLAQVEQWVKRKEGQAAYTRLLYNSACESVLECESVIKGLYGMLGMEYRDTDSEEEEEGAKPQGSVIDVPDDEGKEFHGGVSTDGDEYVVIDLGAAVPEALEEKPKVAQLSASIQNSSASSLQAQVQIDDKTMATNSMRILNSTSTSVPHEGSADFITAVSSEAEMEQIGMSPSRSPELSIKTRESPIPISSNQFSDVKPSTSFRPICLPSQMETSPSSTPVIKTRVSPVPISSQSPDDLPSTSFTPITLPIKRENSSSSPEHSAYSLPHIKKRESPVPDEMSSSTFTPVPLPTKKEISKVENSKPSNSSLSTIKTRESPVPIISPPSPDVSSAPSTPISTSPISHATESPPSTATVPSRKEIHETQKQPKAPTQTSSTSSSPASTSSKIVTVNQKPVTCNAGSKTLNSNTVRETTIEKDKSASPKSGNNPSKSVTFSNSAHSTPTLKETTPSTTVSPSAPSTKTSTKPTDTKNESETPPARVQQEVELKINMNVLGRRRTKTWHQGTILEIKQTESGKRYKVKFDGDKGKSMLSAHHLACVDPPMLKDLFVGCRIVARYKEDDQSWMHAAVIGEMPDRKNRMRFMVFFDDGNASYVPLPDIRMVCKPLKKVYDDIEDEMCRTDVKEYLEAFPNPIFVVVRVGQQSSVQRDGNWEDCTITEVDGSMVQISYMKDKRKEWLYKGSNRWDHIQRIKKRITDQKTEQPSHKVFTPNQNCTTVTTPSRNTTAVTTANRNTTAVTTANRNTTAVTTANRNTTAVTTANRNTTAVTTASRNTTAVTTKTTTAVGSQSVTQTVTTNTVSTFKPEPLAKSALQPKVLLQKILLPSDSSTFNVLKDTLKTEPAVETLSNKGTKRPASAELSTRQSTPLPVVERRLTYVPHRCCPACLDQVRPSQKKEHRGKNPLLIPLLYGFRRMTARRRLDGKMSFHVFYRAPCGRSMCEMEQVLDFLYESRCDFLFLEMFCLDPFVLVKRAMLPSSMNSKPYFSLPDISRGAEALPVPCVNEVDSSHPPPLNYTRQRVPAPGVLINTSLDFMAGCDCTDGCRDRSRCSCHQLTIDATSLFLGGPVDVNAGYVNKRLTRYLPTGVYECNPLCRCDPWMCSNRLVQHGLQLRLQLFMTRHKGWGVRCLDDISKGTFVCNFTGKIVSDDMANSEATASANEYLANLDYIEEVEKQKEGYESEAHCSDAEEENDKKTLVRMTTGSLKKHVVLTVDSSSDEEMEVSTPQIIETNKRTVRKKREAGGTDDETDSLSEYSDDLDDEDYEVNMDVAVKSKFSDDDNRKGYVTRRNAKIQNDMKVDPNPPLPQKISMEQTVVSSAMAKQMRKDGPGDSGTGYARKSTRNFAIKSTHRRVKPLDVSQENPTVKKETPCRRTTRNLFSDERACYLIDAKHDGNIGRYINHSCSPNLFVQNVFVDTHDLRFPWVAFFTSKRIRAGTELTWDYGYEVGSVDGKVLLCCCGSAECTGRLL